MNKSNDLKTIAYRGGCGERPENTMAAFKNAVNTNPKIVLDLDVQLTSDGTVGGFSRQNLGADNQR